MTMLGSFAKQPGETLDYDLECDEWLTDDDFVTSAVSTVTPNGLTVQSPLVFDSGLKVKVWISGGTVGTTYKVQTTMTTAAGRVKEAEFKIKLREI